MKKQQARNEVQQKIAIKQLRKEAFRLMLFGESPLIVNAWSQKAKLEMLKTHLGIPKVREPKDPYKVFLDSIYRFEDGNYGFPVVAVKEAMATATTDLEGIAKAQIYRNVSVTGRRGFQMAAFADISSPMELAELFSPNPPVIREDMVKLAGISRTPDLRYRAEFFPWALRLNMSYLPDFIDKENLYNLIYQAGFRVGLGEWRQEKGGATGAFRPCTDQEIKQVEKWIQAGPKEPKPIDVAAWVRNVTPDKKEEKKKPTGKRKPNGSGLEHIEERYS
jgi:hypothetical protein